MFIGLSDTDILGRVVANEAIGSTSSYANLQIPSRAGGHGNPRAACDEEQNVYRRRQRGRQFWGAAELAGGRTGAGITRRFARRKPASRGVIDPGRIGTEMPDLAPHEVGSQELLLPRPAQELSDQPVRPAAL